MEVPKLLSIYLEETTSLLSERFTLPLPTLATLLTQPWMETSVDTLVTHQQNGWRMGRPTLLGGELHGINLTILVL